MCPKISPEPQPAYDPTQAIPPWLGSAESFELPTRPRTPLENEVFRLMALYPDSVMYTPGVMKSQAWHEAQHTMHISTERGIAVANVLSDIGLYRGLVVTGEPVEYRLGRGGSVTSQPSGRATARKVLDTPEGPFEDAIPLDYGWRRLVPRRLKVTGYLAALLRDGTPALPPVQPK